MADGMAAEAGRLAAPDHLQTQADTVAAGDNFVALGVFAAILLIYGNGLVLTGQPASALWGLPFPTASLDMLFAIAGFTAARSCAAVPSLATALGRGAARLFPGLAACVLGTALVIGPLATRLRMRDYLHDPLTRSYLGNIVLRPRLWLPGVFEGQQWAGVANAMLPLLLPGAAGCLLLALLLRLPWRRRVAALATLAVLTGAASFYLTDFYAGPPSLRLGAFGPVNLANWREMLAPLPFLFGGAVLAVLQPRVAGLWRADWALLGFAANWVAATWIGSWTAPLLWLTIPYMIACFGVLAAPGLFRLGTLGNPVLGMVLAGFAIQQLIIARLPQAPAPIALCVALAFATGLLSWHVVERPALRLAARWFDWGDPVPLPPAVERRGAALGRSNNFDALRVVAALMVIHGHGWNLVGGPNAPLGPGLWGVPFARIGLDVFFAISGYLITESWTRTPALGQFLTKRALRIFPGLAACVVLTAFVLGPAMTRLPIADYGREGESWGYLANIGLNLRLHLPGVFEGLREGGAVNGSLWSLFPEVLCYLTVPLLALAPVRARPWALGGFALLCGGAGVYLFEGDSGIDPLFYGASVKYILVSAPLFMAGAMLRLLHARVPGLFRADVALACFVGNYVVSTWFGWWNLPFEWFALPYMVVAFGLLATPVLRRAARWGDLSFGLYLWAFPVQQAVVATMPGNPLPILTCVAITAVIAFLSWHLVERPALRLKAGLRSFRPSTVRLSSFQWPSFRMSVTAACLFLTAEYALRYAIDPARPGGSAKYPEGWWGWFDQSQTLASVRGFAAFGLDAAQHWYPLGYALLGAPFVSVLPAHAFVLVDLTALLLALSAFVALASRVGVPPLVAAVLFIAVNADPVLFRSWVVPWNTTPASAFLWLLLAGAASWLQDGRRRPFLIGLAVAGLGACRPTDLLLTAPAVTALAWSMLWEARQRERRWDTARGFAWMTAGAAAVTLPYAALHAAIYGWAPSPYMTMSQQTGFTLHDFPWKAYVLLADPTAWFQDGYGLLRRSPWLALGLAGLLPALWRTAAQRRVLPESVLAATLAIHLVLYTAYVDLLPVGLWRYLNIHYFAWALPGYGLLAALLLRDLVRPEAAWRREVAAASLAGTLLIAVVRLEPVPVDRTVAAKMVELRGSVPPFSDAYFTRWVAVDDVGPLENIVVARGFPIRNGMRVIGLRRPIKGELHWGPAGSPGSMATGMAADAAQARYGIGIHFGWPRWLQKRRVNSVLPS